MSTASRWIPVAALAPLTITLWGCVCLHAEIPGAVDEIDPACGPTWGGTAVTIRGTALDLVDDLRLVGLGRTVPVEFTSTPGSLSFNTPMWPDAESVEIQAHVTFEVEGSGGGATTCDGLALLGQFEFIGMTRPEMYDADPVGAGINPYQYDGNCGGLYWRTIRGRGFSGGELMVEFGDHLLHGSKQIEFVSDSEIRIRIPPGTRATWVENIRVRKSPPDCAFDLASSPPGQFLYNQATCTPLAAFARLETTFAGPHFVDVGDVLLDDSGWQDVVLAASGDGVPRLAVYRGDGHGELELDHAVLLAGGSPSAITLADLDGTPQLDAAVTLTGRNELEVFLNDGAGFGSGGETYAVGKRPVAVVAGDFDGDGDLDLAVANEEGRSITLLEQSTSGVLDPSRWGEVAVSGKPRALAAGNFDGVKGVDLAIAIDHTVEVWTSSGDPAAPLAPRDRVEIGVYVPPVVLYPVMDVASGRFRGNELDDLAVISALPPFQLRLFRNDPEKGLESDGLVDLLDGIHSTPLLLEVGDLDGSGYDDVVVARVTGIIEVFKFMEDRLDPWAISPVLFPPYLVSDLAMGHLNSADVSTSEDLVIGLGLTEDGEGHNVFAVWLNNGDGFW